MTNWMTKFSLHMETEIFSSKQSRDAQLPVVKLQYHSVTR